MEKKTIDRIILLTKIILILSVPAYIMVNEKTDVDGTIEEAEPEFVGKESCIECHQSEFDDWVGSDHDKAMAHANDTTVLADFNDAVLERDGLTHKFYKRDGKFYVWTDGSTGEMEEFEVKYTFGYTPLQQFLVEFPGGRLQTLALTWNTRDGKWYHMADEVYAGQDIDHTNWLHWTNQAQNWNGMCADCHSTNLVKGYDPEKDEFNTTFSEINVSCEACHGPASNHITWANKAEYAREEDNDMGLVVQTSGIDNKQIVDDCARCHSRRAAIDDFNHSEHILNHMVPSLPIETNYHVDGQIKEEDYVYGSFTQSKMYMHGVSCVDCHNPHSTKRHFEDNRLCTQCHRADDYDKPEHHHHKIKGEPGGYDLVADDGTEFKSGDGARCINCHMPAQHFMGVDYRNDHSFRIPRPDLTQELGTPNACNQCHKDESVQWAVDKVEEWHGPSRHGHYGIAFEEAKTGSNKGLMMLISIYEAQADSYNEILKATAVEKIGTNYPVRGREILKKALRNSNDHIRLAAARYLPMDGEEALNLILPLLKDQIKGIRLEAASKILNIPNESLPKAYQKLAKEVLVEYGETLKYNADFPQGKFNLANFYYNNKEYAQAEKFYLRAIEQDDQLHAIKINLAFLYNSQGKFDKAEILFKDYLKNVPEDGNVMYNYGLFLSERQRYKESLDVLVKATEYAPNNTRLFLNIANMYDFMNDNTKAEKYFKLTIEKEPENSQYYISLMQYYMNKNYREKAKDLARTILKKFPNMPERQQLETLLKQ